MGKQHAADYADGGNLLSTSNRVRQEELRIGHALREIRDDELYANDGHATFDVFLEKEYGMSPETANSMIRAAEADQASRN
jgi:hypothetical protein